MGWMVNTTPRLATLYPGERPGTHCVRGCVSLEAGLDGCGKSHCPPEFDPWTVQPVASRYTDDTIPARTSLRCVIKSVTELQEVIYRQMVTNIQAKFLWRCVCVRACDLYSVLTD
jgi:hypothetical protein